MNNDNIVYQNAQWKLINNGDSWFFEEKPHDGTQPYWCYVSEVMMHDYSFEHVSEKIWCNLALWSDVCRKAAELSPWKPTYDVDEQETKLSKPKGIDAVARRANALLAKRRNSRLLKPSELAD